MSAPPGAPSNGEAAAPSQPSFSVLLVTSNVGSIFDDPEVTLKNWIEEIVALIAHEVPDFIAVHFQEIGGKHYKEHIREIDPFFDAFIARCESLRTQYRRAAFMCERDWQRTDRFTALGSAFYVSEKVASQTLVWDVGASCYVPLSDPGLSGASAHERFSVHEKFPATDFGPESKSRKGFMKTRWSVCGVELALVNLHLFHDDSNIVAFEKSPSHYARNRQRAFTHVVRRCCDAAAAPLLSSILSNPSTPSKAPSASPARTPAPAASHTPPRPFAPAPAPAAGGSSQASPASLAPGPGSPSHEPSSPWQAPPDVSANCAIPIFFFGDFNFRLDMQGTVRHIAGGACEPQRVRNESGEETRYIYRDSVKTEPLLTFGARQFSTRSPQRFLEGGGAEFRAFDIEPDLLLAPLGVLEMPVAFPPTYPYSETNGEGAVFLERRCPSWCDRVLMNASGRALVLGSLRASSSSVSAEQSAEGHGTPASAAQAPAHVPSYSSVAHAVCVGDHKPVFLSFSV